MKIEMRAHVIEQLAKVGGAGRLSPDLAPLGIAVTALILGAYFPEIAEDLVEHTTDGGLTIEMAAADLVYHIGVNLPPDERAEWEALVAEDMQDDDVQAALEVVRRLKKEA